MSTRRTKVSLPVSPRAPQDEKGLLTWAQKELHQFFIQVRDVINNLADAVGGITSDTYKVKVDSSQTPVYAEDAVAAGAGVTIAKTGTTPDKVLTIAATGDHKFATDATDEANGGAGYALDKLSSTGNVKPTLDTSGGQRRTQFNVTLPAAFPGFYEEDPEPVGEEADPGDSPLVSHGNHVHGRSPTPAITTTFYGSLDDSPAEGQSLVPVCPSSLGLVEVACTGGTDPSPPIPFGTLAGSPGLAYWSGGVVNIVVRARIRDIEEGATHLLAADLWRVPLVGAPVHYSDHNVGSYDDSIALTGTLQTLRFTARVKPLTGATTDRLLVNFLELPGQGGSLPTEYLAIQTGSFSGTVEIPDATQIQTVFGPDTGGTGVHGALDGRDAVDQHPWSSMEPVGLAKVPFLGATLAAADSGGTNGKLALGASNRYLADPNSLDLTQIQTPTVAAGTTVEVMVMFTAPCLLVPNVAPDTGYTKLHLAQDAGVTGLNLANPYSSMKFIYVAALSAFVRIQEAEL